MKKKSNAANKTIKDGNMQDSLFCFHGVDFGYVVAGDEAFSLCWKGFSFPPLPMPGIEKCVQLLKNCNSNCLKVSWGSGRVGKVPGTSESSGKIHSSCWNKNMFRDWSKGKQLHDWNVGHCAQCCTNKSWGKWFPSWRSKMFVISQRISKKCFRFLIGMEVEEIMNHSSYDIDSFVQTFGFYR